MNTKLIAALLCFGLASCQTGASHLPAPWQVPGMVIGGAIENSIYGARRGRVETFITQNYGVIIRDMHKGAGPALEQAFTLARIDALARRELIQNIVSRPDIYFSGPRHQDIDRLIVAFMVHGN